MYLSSLYVLNMKISLVSYSPWSCKESDTSEQLTLNLQNIFREIRFLKCQLVIFWGDYFSLSFKSIRAEEYDVNFSEFKPN